MKCYSTARTTIHQISVRSNSARDNVVLERTSMVSVIDGVTLREPLSVVRQARHLHLRDGTYLPNGWSKIKAWGARLLKMLVPKYTSMKMRDISGSWPHYHN